MSVISMKDTSKEEVWAGVGRIANSSYLNPTASFEMPVDIADNVTIYGNTQIGKFSYINVGCVVYSNVTIGRFCSIGRSVEIGLARHPSQFLSTHPFQCNHNLFARYPGYADINKKDWVFHPETIVGHDVWIGAKVGIASGVTIGTGSIIAAGAIVTKDVPPYAIVGGVPAKVIKMRFSKDIIEKLLKYQWWDLDLEVLSKLPFDDIETCVEMLDNIFNET